MIQVFARKNKPKAAEIRIYDYIGEDWYGDGCSAKKIADDLKAIGEVDDILVRINSPGGSIFDGIGIYNQLKSHGAKITVAVEGVAASAASIIAMAGSTIKMGTATKIMIHNPWTLAYGEAKDFRKTADTLDEIRNGMLDAYAERTGMDRKELAQMCDDETWMGPDAAIEKGFADEKLTPDEDDSEDDEEPTDKAKALIASFRNVPKDFALRRIAAAPKPAAAAALPEVHAMTPEEIEAARKAAADAAAEQARTNFIAANKVRQEAIRALFAPFVLSHSELMNTCLSDVECTEQAASAKLLKALGEGAEPLRPAGGPGGAAVVPGATERDKFLAGAESAIMNRLGGKREAGNEFNGASLHELAAHALRRSGVNCRGMTKDQIARKVLASHTTSDFPLLMSNVARKRLRDAYTTVPRTWDKLAAIGSVPDFKENTRLTLGSFSSLVLKPERGEYKQGTIGEEEVGIKIATKGRYISLSREMIINDDLNGFGTMAKKMGQAAGRTVEIDFYALLYLNSGTGPTMDDTGALFNATAVTTAGGHANYVSSGTVISVTSLGAANAMMKRQRDLSLLEYVGIEPKILLVAPEYEALAWTIINSTADPGQANPARGNYARTLNLTVVSSPYVQGTDWFLFADPNLVEAIEVAFLDGEREPFIDEEIEFMSDAMNMKVRLDYGLAAIDFRAAFKNEGAAS
jgi:ATP-dependent Clp endopeptidase proteolytic subunit ClpP